MDNSTHRLEILRLLLSRGTLGGQVELVKILARHNIDVSQGTLSRDLKRLRAVKVQTRDGVRYVLPEEQRYKRVIGREQVEKFVSETGFERIAFSGSMAVIHTRPGYAAVLATDIDRQHPSTVVGTIAGYDTVFVALRDDAHRADVIEELAVIMPGVLEGYVDEDAPESE